MTNSYSRSQKKKTKGSFFSALNVIWLSVSPLMFLCGCKILPISISQNCPSKCSRYRDCAQCKAFGTGKYSDDQCVELCPDVIMVDKLECECNTSYLNMPFWKRWTVVCIASNTDPDLPEADRGVLICTSAVTWFPLGTFLDAVEARSLEICMEITSVMFYMFAQVSLTLASFQNMGVKTIMNVSSFHIEYEVTQCLLFCLLFCTSVILAQWM